jgi:ribosomal protein L5
MAVIEELVEVMKDQMQDSKRVKLDGFGSFKIGLNCRGARSAKAFTINDNIEGMHVVFTPERSHDQAGNRTKQFLQGVKVEELPENKVDKDEEGGD